MANLKVVGVTSHKTPLSTKGMGVMPVLSGSSDTFVPPNYGPPRAKFWDNGEDFQEYKIMYAEGPNDFYVQNTKDLAELRKMEADMRESYNDYWRKNKPIAKDNVERGGFYAVYMNKFETWHRARVDDFVVGGNQTEYMVQLLDYGTRALVTLNEIYPLRAKDLKLETQACHAWLYNESRPKLSWTLKQNRLFQEDVFEKTLEGIVLKAAKRRKETFPSLCMVLLNDDEEVYTFGDRVEVELPQYMA